MTSALHITHPGMKRFALLLGGLFGAMFLLAAPASAHSELLSSTPANGARLNAAPHTVTLKFNESVRIAYVHVTNQSGDAVDARAAYHPDGDGTTVADDLKPGLGDGSYTASWRMISTDSHPVAGSIPFVVGNGPLAAASSTQGGSTVMPVVADAFDVARWVSYVGLALLGGGWLVLTVWPAGREEPRARRLLWTGWAALGVGGLGEFLLQGPASAGSGLGKLASGTLLDETLRSDYGQFHVIRLVLLGLLALVLARALRPGTRASRWDVVACALGVAVVWTFSRSGHAATTSPSWLSVYVDMAHVLAMTVWLGGLIMLLGAVFPRRDQAELKSVLPVFSNTAFTAVTVLVASGVYGAWRGIGTVHAIFATTYGLIVVGKVLLLAAILAVANQSRRLVRRRVVAYAMTDTLVATEPEQNKAEIRVDRLRRAVWVEAVVALVVLGFTAVLVAEPRGKEALLASYRAPVSATAPLTGGHTLDITATPGTHGPVTITARLAGGDRATSISATATQRDRQIGPLPIKLARDGVGQYYGTVTLPADGTWQLDFVVTTSSFAATDTDTTIRLH